MAEQKQLLLHLKQKKEDALEMLLAEYGSLMRYIIAPILSDSRDREECLSDVALQVWEKIDMFDPGKSSFTTWLTVVTRNAAVSRSRRRHPDTEELPETYPAETGDPVQVVLRKEQQQALNRALVGLREDDRLLFYRKYFYMQSTAQIAAELGTTERSVEGRLYRIRQRLKKQLEGV